LAQPVSPHLLVEQRALHEGEIVEGLIVGFVELIAEVRKELREALRYHLAEVRGINQLVVIRERAS
jgi:hypothetical protein